MKFRTLLTATALSASIFAAAATSANAFDDTEKKEIGEIVREYLLQNPEIMIEIQQTLQQKQETERLAQAKSAVKDNYDAIFNAPYDLSIGNPKGKVTIVEFFDYNCGYCKRALSDMNAVIKSNPDVRFVLKEFPILGPDSLAAHKVSAAFRLIAPEKYGEFHHELLGNKAHADEARALAVAESLGVSEKAIREKMTSSPSDESVQDAYKLATKLGISGTPSYIIGDEAVFGAVGADELNEKIANIGQCGKASC
ncbi:DsbA family protein [Rhizobium sp. KVB221]|uniref:DsbA family protein n=1 Tax=Rhizobium setariae TaxID=2801340 RepID=A0A936YWM0_9HYPH|nr:DsbA family protein [Rhizobium setariae]MBL0374805.1 DsbA family protein [Rhizobium setariae]